MPPKTSADLLQGAYLLRLAPVPSRHDFPDDLSHTAHLLARTGTLPCYQLLHLLADQVHDLEAGSARLREPFRRGGSERIFRAEVGKQHLTLWLLRSDLAACPAVVARFRAVLPEVLALDHPHLVR